MNKKALISLKVFSAQSFKKLKLATKLISEVGKIEKLSSVFRVNRVAESYRGILEYDSRERLAGLSCVLELSFMGEPRKLIKNLEQIESECAADSARREVSINLLLVDQAMLQTPSLSLPHPEFHLRPEELVPACEIAADWTHPILKMTLKEIGRSVHIHEWGEFYCQGEDLLANDDPQGANL